MSHFFYFPIVCLLIFLSLLLSACKPGGDGLQGYVDGRYTYISSNVSGRLKQLLVKRGDWVSKGKCLFVLEAEPEVSQLKEAQFRVLQAQDQLMSAKAGLDLAKITWNRQVFLKKKNATEVQTVDQTKTQYEQAFSNWQQATKNVEALKAALERIDWFYHEKKIYASKSGLIFDTYYVLGETVPSYGAVVSLLSAKDIYVIFYVSGNQLSQLKLNQKVGIIRQGSSQPIPAKITYISPSAEYAPPIIYSTQTNHKLVFRIEATPLQSSSSLHPGEPVQVDL